jgi:hypothetical protein
MRFTFTLLLALLSSFRAYSAMDIGVSPLFIYGEWDQVRAYKNLSPSSDGMTLDLDQNSDGYMIQTKRRIGAMSGFVGKITANLLQNNAVMDFGLAPVVKTNATFIGHIDKLSDESKSQFIPLSEKNLDDYKIGDSSFIELEGGVAIHLGAQYGLLHAGGKYLVAGGWSCLVKKIAEDEVYIELKKIRETSKTVYANLTFPYLESGILDNHNFGFAYIINFKNPDGLKAYGHFLLGRMDKIEEIENIVTKVKTFKSDRKTKFTGMGVGVPIIPIINFSTTKETSKTNEEVSDYRDNINQSEYALSLRKRDMTFFGLQKTVDTAFLIKKQKDEISMQMFFRHITNFSNSDKLITVKETLKKLTGLDDFLEFKIKDKEKLNFAELEFAINFGPKLIEILRNDRQQLITLLKDIKINSNIEKREIDSLIKMLAKKDYALTDIARFGQKLWDSPTLFQFEMNLIRNCGGELGYEVSGKRISRLLRYKNFEENENCPLN